MDIPRWEMSDSGIDAYVFCREFPGECKPVMQSYLACLKKQRGTNDPECRLLAKAYLQCRMDQYVSLVLHLERAAYTCPYEGRMGHETDVVGNSWGGNAVI